MFWFALKTLLCDRGKAVTALVGVAFSVVLVDVQGGLYFGLINKASLLTDHCNADLWVAHRGVESVDFAQDIPVARLNRIRGLPGVQDVEPYVVGKGIASLADGGYEDVWIIGHEPQSSLGGPWGFVQGSAADLLRPDSIGIDELDAVKLGNPAVGDVLEVNGRRAAVVAKTRGILGFMTTPYLFATLNTARRMAHIPDGYCSYFLVRAESGVELEALQEAIEERVPEFDVYTSDEFGQISQNYFLKRTGIGISFGASTLLGLLVGLTIVGQSLYSLVLDHMSEYATLKAIGAEDHQVRSVVVLQAVAIAVVGSAIGLVAVIAIQRTMSTPVAPIEIPTQLMVGGVVVVFLICLLSTVLPIMRIRRVDPASVLRG
jgi:putative ABC transport system permease protein